MAVTFLEHEIESLIQERKFLPQIGAAGFAYGPSAATKNNTSI